MRHVLVVAAIVSVFLTSEPAKADLPHQWALIYLKAEQVWETTKGSGVTVAIVDSGAQPDADLSSNLLPGADFSDMTGKSIGDGHTDVSTDGHGTGMAVLIGGSGTAVNGSGTIGLAPAAQMLPIRASLYGGSGLSLGLAPGIDYAVNHSARVINVSAAVTANDPDIRRAVQSALDHDVVVVAGVGNDGAPRLNYPAAWPGVLGVGAIDSTGTVWDRSNIGPDVALVAPGVHIFRDDNQGRLGYSDGTSEATAYVSAAAALVRSAHPAWTAPQVAAALTATADKPAAMHGASRDDHYGAGILDVLAAVKLAAPPDVASVPSSASALPPQSSGGSTVGAAPSSATGSASHTSGSASTAWALLAAGGALVAGVGVVLFAFRRRRG